MHYGGFCAVGRLPATNRGGEGDAELQSLEVEQVPEGFQLDMAPQTVVAPLQEVMVRVSWTPTALGSVRTPLVLLRQGDKRLQVCPTAACSCCATPWLPPAALTLVRRRTPNVCAAHTAVNGLTGECMHGLWKCCR